MLWGIMTGIIVAIGWVLPGWLSLRPAMILVLILWIGALITVVLPARSQLLLFWTILPFVSFLKRIVFLDDSAGTTQMYLVLAAQDIVLSLILFKLFVTTLKSGMRIRLSSVDISVILFGAYSLFAALLLSSNAPLSARLAAIESRVLPMVMFFLTANYLNRARDVNTVSRLLVGSSVIVALYGIHQFFNGFLPFEEAWFTRASTSTNAARLQYEIYQSGVFRTFATMDSHGTYGLFLGIGIILAQSQRFRTGVFVWGTSSLILALGLVLSFTRYTWIMPPIAVAFVVLFQYGKIKPLFNLRRLRKGSLLFLAVTGSFFLIYLIASNLYGRQLVTASNPYLLRAFGTSTLYARLQWTSLLSTRNISLLGNGLATTVFFARKFGFATNDIDYHNIVVDMLDSMGIIGLGLFSIMLYLLSTRAITNIEIQRHRQQRRLLATLFGLILAMLIVSHFNGAVFYYGRAIPYYFWGICGMVVHYNWSFLNHRQR